MSHVQRGGDPIRPQPGSQIDPTQAVGRARTTRTARRDLLAGSNLLLSDPRRMGKTVWLEMFCADPGPGLIAVKIDYEGVHTTDEFLVRTARGLAAFQGLPGRALATLRTLFDNLDVSAAAGPVEISAAVQARSRAVLLADTIDAVGRSLPADQVLVIAMDEVPIAIWNIAGREDPDAARELLQTLRELRRREDGLRWIVCGSVGLHHVLRRCATTEGAINDLVNLPLGPLTEKEAISLGRRVLAGAGRPGNPEAIVTLLEHTDRIPFLIHAIAHRLQDHGAGPVGSVDVAAAFDALLDDRDDSRAVTHLVSRLEPYYGEHADLAGRVLDRIAVNETARGADLAREFPAWILNGLIDDHYLAERRGTVRWRYPVLRAIWMHRRRLT